MKEGRPSEMASDAGGRNIEQSNGEMIETLEVGTLSKNVIKILNHP
jgi:hypothetical protein